MSFLNNAECYYVISKGKAEKRLFSCTSDYAFFVRLLKRSKKKFNVRLYAFCLMPDYIELVISIPHKECLPRFMKEILETYSLYFEKKYSENDGPCFNRYKSMVIESDADLVEYIEGVESNPVRADLADTAEHYPWSSCCFRGIGAVKGLIDTQA